MGGLSLNKNDLKVGDVIRFHHWGSGGFLFGIIIEQEDDLYHSKLNIWRPKDIYYLQGHGVDNITLIKDKADIKEYEIEDFQDLIKKAQVRNVYNNLR